jgi:receptor expression-enhancing protein 5/6
MCSYKRAIWIRYASICAMESTSKLDDEQWLAYWIIFSFITLLEMAAQHVIYW